MTFSLPFRVLFAAFPGHLHCLCLTFSLTSLDCSLPSHCLSLTFSQPFHDLAAAMAGCGSFASLTEDGAELHVVVGRLCGEVATASTTAAFVDLPLHFHCVPAAFSLVFHLSAHCRSLRFRFLRTAAGRATRRGYLRPWGARGFDRDARWLAGEISLARPSHCRFLDFFPAFYCLFSATISTPFNCLSTASL